jgi:TonB family protein
MCDPLPYPPIPRSEQAENSVTVETLIDEEGHVISARVVSGEEKLRQAALDAAMKAKFKPTILSGKPVEVRGIITYTFVKQ